MKQIPKMVIIQSILMILSMCAFFSCAPRPEKAVKNLRQGIAGQIVLVQGNNMPSPDQKKEPPAGVQCSIYIHALTGPSQVEESAPSFYKKINTPLLKSFKSGKDGHFAVALPPGDYSLFMGVDSLFYANISDGSGNIHPIHVGKDSVTTLRLSLDHKAVY